MRFVRKHFGIALPIEQAGVRRAPGSRPKMPTPSISPAMLFRLCEYVVSPTRNVYLAAVAAAMIFCCFSCNRCEQANACVFDSVSSQGFLSGTLAAMVWAPLGSAALAYRNLDKSVDFPEFFHMAR